MAIGDYYGDCPSCDNESIETLSSDWSRMMMSGDEVYVYTCRCNECHVKFYVTEYYDGRKDEIEIILESE